MGKPGLWFGLFCFSRNIGQEAAGDPEQSLHQTCPNAHCWADTGLIRLQRVFVR
jgi:hypothetical protein